jgi:hypothetical protein
MAMNGGTSLRFEGISSRLAFSSMALLQSARAAAGGRPAVAAFHRFPAAGRGTAAGMGFGHFPRHSGYSATSVDRRVAHP